MTSPWNLYPIFEESTLAKEKNGYMSSYKCHLRYLEKKNERNYNSQLFVIT
jgi:hypothetical protein